MYVGGGTGTPQDPYTFEEYQNLVSSGTWLGGFVAGSTETYTRDESGNFVKSEVNDAIYIEKDCRVLPDLVVDATRKDKKKDQYDDNSGFWGFSDDNDRDSSGTYISDPSGNWIGSENLDGGGGGGSTQRHKRIIADARGAIPKFIGYDPDDKLGCLRRCLNMLGYSNNSSIRPIKKIQMVTKGDNGRAGAHTAEYQEGLNLINTLLAQKRPVVVGIDYSGEN